MTDTQLKQKLAEMLPDKVYIATNGLIAWLPKPEFESDGLQDNVLDTELLHLCWLVEEAILKDGNGIEAMQYNVCARANRGRL